MTNRQIGMIVGVLFGGLVGWFVYWFVTIHELHYREVRVGLSAEARRNPFLAAERFLRGIGMDSQSIPSREYLLQPPQETGVLLVNRLSPNLSPEHERALLEWIENGGHLMVTADREWDENGGAGVNPLLERFGIRLRIQDRSEEPESSEGAVDDRKGDASTMPLLLSFPGYPGDVRVTFDAARVLEETTALADWAVEAEEEGAHLLQFGIGRGLLTVLSDHHFLLNDHIGEQDHALFLALLTQGEGRAWLLYSSRMPSLFTLVWRAVPYLVLSLLVLAALWLWSLTLRTGPLLRPETRVRRNLLEHLDAAADYAWQTDRAAAMLTRSQKALDQAWRRRHPALDRMGRRERCERIAERAGVAAVAVAAALYGRADKEQVFIRTSAVQQRLLARISHQEGR